VTHHHPSQATAARIAHKQAKSTTSPSFLTISLQCNKSKSINRKRSRRAAVDEVHFTRAFWACHTATHCNTRQHPCITLQHTATHCNTLQHTATHCNTLQHTATHCNTRQHAATHCTTLRSEEELTPPRQVRCSVL